MRRITCLLLVLAVAMVPACARQASARERIAQAPATTQQQGTARIATKLDMLGGAQDMSMTGEGAIEFESQRSTMTMDLGAVGAQTGMAKMEMRTDGRTIYMKLPNAQQLGLPTPWLKMDLDSMAGLQGLGQLSQMNNTDPTSSMEMLRGVADVEEIGSEDIRGAATTHYRATIDIDKAIEDAPADMKKQLQTQFEALGSEAIPADVWIDDEGRLRRQDISMDLSKAQGAAGGGQGPTEVKVSIEMYGFGTDVDVQPPPASEVTDFADIQGGAGG